MISWKAGMCEALPWICYDASAMIGYVKFTSLRSSQSKNGVNLFLYLKTKATRWCPTEQNECKSDEISVQLTIFEYLYDVYLVE